MAKSLPAFRYQVDQDDKLVWVDDAFLGFARENGAPELTEDALLPHSLWDAIADDTTCRLYQQVHHLVRQSGKPFLIPIRCDSPTLIRNVQLRITPESDGALLYESRLMSVEVRPTLRILERGIPRNQSVVTMCSCCLKCLIEPHGWMEADQAMQRLPRDYQERVPQLRYTICAACADIPYQCPNGSVA